jgi:hypothetical protein
MASYFFMALCVVSLVDLLAVEDIHGGVKAGAEGVEDSVSGAVDHLREGCAFAFGKAAQDVAGELFAAGTAFGGIGNTELKPGESVRAQVGDHRADTFVASS